MAFVGALAPYLAAAGAVVQGVQQKNAADYNAKVAGQEQNASINQANAQEGMVRRASRESLGKQAAAFGAAGVGYGGSSEGALDQSAVNEEWDALNTRYKGQTTGYGYGVQASIDRSEGSTLAGNALLKGLGSYYAYQPKSAAAMAGLQVPGS